MDPIEPILPDRPTILPVYAAERAAGVHRDGRGGGGAPGEHRRRPREDDGAEVDVQGVEEPAAGEDRQALPSTAPSAALLPPTSHVDVSA